MAIAQDIITNALLHLAVYQPDEPIDPSDLDDGLTELNNLVTNWDVERLNIWSLAKEDFPLVAGKQSYTMGPGGNFNTLRPVSIRNVSCIYTDGSVTPVELIDSPTYGAILERGLQAPLVERLYNDNAYPVVNLYMWPVPNNSGVQIEISSWQQLGTFAALTTPFSFPPGYQAAVEYNLAVWLAPMFSRPVSQELMLNAQSTLATIRKLNQPPTPGTAEDAQAAAQVAQTTLPPQKAA